MTKAWRGAIPFAALVVLAVPAIAPLAAPGYFAADDASLHRWRLWAFWQEWQRGQVPVRWSSDLAFGFGSPVFSYYGPLGYLLGAAALAWGLGSAAATKAVFALALVVGAAGAWALARAWLPADLCTPGAGLVGAASYLYAPYVLTSVYRRAAIGECVALAIAPWFLRALLAVRAHPSAATTLVLAATVAGLVTAHVFTAAAMAAIAALLLVAWQRADDPRLDRRRAAGVVCGAALGVGLSAFYWLPSTLDVGFVHWLRTRGAEVPAFYAHLMPIPDMLQYTLLHDYDLDLARLPPTWPHLGFVQVAALVAAAVVVVHRGAWRRWQAFVPALAIGGAVFLASLGSKPLWEAVGALQSVQYPWRSFGPIAVLGAAIVPAAVVGRQRPLRAALLLAAVLALAGGAVRVTRTTWLDSWDTRANLWDYEVGTYLPGLATFNEFFPRWVDRASGGLLQPVAAQASGTAARLVAVAGLRPEAARLSVDAPAATALSVDTFYFPSWSAWVDGRPTDPHAAGELGLLTVDVPPGRHEIAFARGRTAAAEVGDAVTLVSFAVALALGARALRRAWRRSVLWASTAAFLALVAPLGLAAARPTTDAVFLAAPPSEPAEPVSLLGAMVSPARGSGELELDVPFYVQGVPETAPALHVRLISPDGRATMTSEHTLGGALRPRVVWQPGTIYHDRFAVAPLEPVRWVDLSLDDASPVRLGPLVAEAASTTPAQRYPPEQTAVDAPVVWSGGLVLEHSRAWPNRPMPSGPAPSLAPTGQIAGYRAELFWRRTTTRPLSDRATLRLVDGQRTSWASAEVPVELPAGTDRTWQSVELGPWQPLPPNRYKLELTLQDAAGRPSSIDGPARLAGQSEKELDAFDVDPPCACVPPGGSVVGVDLLGGLRLLGYTRDVSGSNADVTLYWQARDRVPKRYTSFVHLLGPDQTLKAQFDRSPYDDHRPTDEMQLGDVVPFFARLPIPVGGPFRLEAGLYDDPRVGHLQRADGGDVLPLGLVDTRPLPSGLSVDFDNGARLVGARLEREGGRLLVTLAWRATRRIERTYTVFVHVVGPDGRIVAQGDGPPELGTRGTPEWPRGETILDPHSVELGVNGGPLRVLVGLYRPGDGVRARAGGGQDRVDLGQVPAP